MKPVASGSANLLRHRFVFSVGSDVRGPCNLATLQQFAASGVITPCTPLAIEGTADFRIAADWPIAPALFPKENRIQTIQRITTSEAVPTPTHQPIPLASSSSSTDAPPKLAPRAPPGQHISSEEELNARLAKDPNDPVVIATVVTLRERMRAEKLTAQEALRLHLSENRQLNQKLSTPTKYRYVSLQTQVHRLTVATAACGFSCLIVAYIMAGSPIERTYAWISMASVNFVLLLCYIWGLRWQRWLDLHPFLVACGMLASSTVLTSLLCALIIWAFDPFSTFADVLFLLCTPLLQATGLLVAQ